MTSRQRVRAALEFSRPDRIPYDLWALPLAEITHGKDAVAALRAKWPSDIVQCTVGRAAAKRVQGSPTAVGTYIDEWGCVFENLQEGVIGEVKHPLLDDYSKLSDLRPPEELLAIDIAVVNEYCRSTDKYVFASGWLRPWERMQFLRGSENLYMDIAEDSPDLHAFLNIVDGYFVKQIEAWSKTNVDAVVLMDDWGAQRGLLISPTDWRRLFKPRYARYCQIARDAGKKIFMHSDGDIQSIYPDLIEIGVNAINSQLFCMDIERLGRECKGKITFWGELDRQHILPFGSPAQVRAGVQRVFDNLYSPNGGIIAQCEIGGPGTVPNADLMFQTWQDLTT